MKKKGLTLKTSTKTSTSHYEASDEDPSKNSDNENLNFLVKKFSKFTKKKGKNKGNFKRSAQRKVTPLP